MEGAKAGQCDQPIWLVSAGRGSSFGVRGPDGATGAPGASRADVSVRPPRGEDAARGRGEVDGARRDSKMARMRFARGPEGPPSAS